MYRHRAWEKTGIDPGPSKDEVPDKPLDYEDLSDPVIRRLIEMRDSPSALVAILYDQAREGNWSRSAVMRAFEAIAEGIKTPEAYTSGSYQYQHRVWVESLPSDYFTKIETGGWDWRECSTERILALLTMPHQQAARTAADASSAGEESALYEARGQGETVKRNVLEFRHPTAASEDRLQSGPAATDKEAIVGETRTSSARIIDAFADQSEGDRNEQQPQLELDESAQYFYGPFAFDPQQSADQQQWKAPYQQIIREISLMQYLGEGYGNPRYRQLIAEAQRRIEAAGDSRGAQKDIAVEGEFAHSLNTERDGDLILMREIHHILQEDDFEDRYISNAS